MAGDLKRVLGSRLRAARLRAGLSQEALAAKVSKTPESISNIERGRHLPMLETLASLASAVDVPLTEFFEGADAPSQSARRLALEARLRELVRGLDDDGMASAVDQVDVLARALKR